MRSVSIVKKILTIYELPIICLHLNIQFQPCLVLFKERKLGQN